ncbi:MAG: IclR family transcriptional regulator [Desulfomicrobium sp.]|nr:IclR family transcriptional regulator [Desulfomicrobium sp.]
MTSDPDGYFSKTLEKGLSILNLFDKDHSRRNLSEISRLTGINKTSTYRLVNTLVLLGLLSKNPRSKTLRLGPKALLLGHTIVQGFELLHMIKPLIDETHRLCNVTIDSILVDGQTLLALYRREASSTLFFRHPLASRDLHARATGKAVLSRMDQSDLESFLANAPYQKFTPNTIDRADDLLKEIEEIRKQGYSINNQEYVQGLICIGAPLINHQNNKVTGAISFDLPADGYTVESVITTYAGQVTKLANSISEIVTMNES